MALHIKTYNPEQLLDSIYEFIRKKEIEAWITDIDGDFTHRPEQWIMEAWLRPFLNEKELVFGIISRRNTPLSKVVYAVYHGRFSEMLLSYFDDEIDSIEITSNPDCNDSI